MTVCPPLQNVLQIAFTTGLCGTADVLISSGQLGNVQVWSHYRTSHQLQKIRSILNHIVSRLFMPIHNACYPLQLLDIHLGKTPES